MLVRKLRTQTNDHSKGFRNDQHIKVGDIVLFLKTEKEYSKQYQYGKIQAIEPSRDGKVRTVNVRYRNPSEKKERETRRAVRELIIIHRIDEIFIFQELDSAAKIL